MSLSLTSRTEGLVFYYQPPLTPEEIETGAHQPENVVGSYAVYHATRGNLHASAEEAARYKTGKAYHIFRPLVKDAAGNETWGDFARGYRRGHTQRHGRSGVAG